MGTGLARGARQRAGRRPGHLRRQADPLKSMLEALALDTEQEDFGLQRSAPDRSPYALEPCKDHGVLSTSGK
jgi:hypothetical protein